MIKKFVLNVEWSNLFATSSSACSTCKQYKQQLNGHLALYFLCDYCSKIAKISNNNMTCPLLCLKVYDSKEYTYDDEKSQHRDDTKCVNCRVNMLCRNWQQNAEILVICDGTSENVDIRIKEGEGKRDRTFIRSLDELPTMCGLVAVHIWSGARHDALGNCNGSCRSDISTKVETKVLLQGHRVANKALTLEKLKTSMCDVGDADAGGEVTFDRANYQGNAHGTTDASIKSSDIDELKCCSNSMGRRSIDSRSYWSMARVMLALLFVLSQIMCIVGVVPDDEIFALERFYSSTNGDDWLWRREDVFGPKWNFSSDVINPCATYGKVWQGINCSHAASLCGGAQICHITSIVLNRYQVRGTLPPELKLLSNMSTLNLNHNLITGPIPETFGNITTLTVLDLSTNNITGIIPLTLANLLFLKNLTLESNFLSGSIPPELGDLVSLQSLELSINALTGTIPPELGNLLSLQYLHFDSNALSGTIPPELGVLASLHYLNISSNALSGTIPPELGDLVFLQYLYINSNALSGTIPPELGDLAYLQYLNISSNALSGTIPPELGDLVSLLYLSLYRNALSGSIPSKLGDLMSLQNLELFRNVLSGSIPPELGYVVSLQSLQLYRNVLSGSIPSELGDLVSLLYLYLYSNTISGTLPPELGNLASLQNLDLQSNALSGTLPPEFGDLLSLKYLDIDLNALSGTIPSEFGDLLSLQYLELYSNALSGTIPPELGSLSSLLILYLSINVLSGTIPLEVENLCSLEVLDLSNNILEGSVSTNIAKMVNLQQLFLYSNQLIGSLSKWFGNGQYSNISLVNIDASDNRFSGSIPSELFLLPELKTVALTKNCFTGTLPSSMCDAVKVSVFSMDGLGSAAECKHTYSLPFTNVLLGKSVHGSMPRCLLLLENMTVLSLSANYLTGELGELGESSSLVNLTISHNYISGTIPFSILSHDFQSLDLSYNKIRGYVDDYTGSKFVSPSRNISLLLAVNRLSGGLPDFSAMTFYTLDILSGNIFNCGMSVGNDESSDTYVCGSAEFNQLLISLCAFFGVLILIAIWMFYFCYIQNNEKSGVLVQNGKYLLEYWRVACALDKSMYPSVTSLINCLRTINKSVWVICGCIIVFTAPIYILKAMDYGKANPAYTTHSIVYAWEMTTAYFTGELPGGLLVLGWFGCVFVFVLLMKMAVIAANNSNSVSQIVIYNTQSDKASYMVFMKFTVMLLVNICVVGSMNGLYVYLTLQELDVTMHTLIQMCFACVKYIWNFVVVPAIVFSPLPISPYRSWLKLFTNMLNSVFLPCIASLFTSTSCFRGVFFAPPEITSTYEYEKCDAFSTIDNFGKLDNFGKIVCKLETTVNVDVVPFVPPFAYNNLCGSVILTSYIPVFIYVYILSILVTVIWTYVCCTYVDYSKCPKWIQNVLMGVMWPYHDWCSAEVSLSPNVLSKRLLKADNSISNILHHAGILLTFGLCSPVLAITIAVYVSIYVLVLLIVVGRFVMLIKYNRSNNTTVQSEVVAALELASANSEMYVNTCMWEVVWMSSIFFAVLCWDMASDRVYWKKAVWIPVTAIALPLILWLSNVMLSKYYFLANGEDIDIDENKQSYGDVASNRYSSQHTLQSNHQVSNKVELLRLTFSEPVIANVDVIGDINVDGIHSDYEHHSEVASPLTTPSKV